MLKRSKSFKAMRTMSRHPDLAAHVLQMYHFLEPHCEGEGIRVRGGYIPKFAREDYREVTFQLHSSGCLCVRAGGKVLHLHKRKHWKHTANSLFKLFKQAHKHLVRHGEIRLPAVQAPEDMQPIYRHRRPLYI